MDEARPDRMGVLALEEALGTDIVTLPAAFDGRMLADWSGIAAGHAVALIRPRDTAQLSTALAICNAHRIRVAIQGGLTGLAGAATVRDGEVAISLERMSAIEDVDPISATMTVQAGAVLQAVQHAALDAGYYFPLDLGARGSCTIGGALATNAGGNRVIKYGMMRDQVLAVEAVLADGRVIGGLHKMIKNNAGYDMTNLLIGSEGTLAVITRAVLRLQTRPTGILTAFCGLGSLAAVTTLLRRAQSDLSGGVSAFEVMWPNYYDFVLAHSARARRPLGQSHAYYVLLETDGPASDAQAAQFEGLLGTLLQEGVIEDAAIAASERDALDFWTIRDAAGELAPYIPNAIPFDISFAVRDIAEAAQRISTGIETLHPGALALFYGHLGDGNIHLIVQLPGDDRPAAEAVEALVYGIVFDVGGSVSAEHGIGLKKKNMLAQMRGSANMAAMAALKLALDPNQILGHDRIFYADKDHDGGSRQ